MKNYKRKRESEKERDRQTDREAEREGETDRQTDKQRGRVRRDRQREKERQRESKQASVGYCALFTSIRLNSGWSSQNSPARRNRAGEMRATDSFPVADEGTSGRKCRTSIPTLTHTMPGVGKALPSHNRQETWQQANSHWPCLQLKEESG